MGQTEVKEEDPFEVTTKSLYPAQLSKLQEVYKSLWTPENGRVEERAFIKYLSVPEPLSDFVNRFCKVIKEVEVLPEELPSAKSSKKSKHHHHHHKHEKSDSSFTYKQLVNILEVIYRGRSYQHAGLFVNMYAKDKTKLTEDELTSLFLDCAYLSELNRFLYTKEEMSEYNVDIDPYKKNIESILKHIESVYDYPISGDNFANYLGTYLPSVGKALEYFVWIKLLKKQDEEMQTDDYLDFWPPYLLSSDISTLPDIDSLVWLLACSIELNESTWKVQYAVTTHGQSLNRLCSEVLEYGGPTIFIILDSDGGIFGCFTREAWKSRLDFREDKSAFLFSLRPHFGIYRATGAESHNLFLNNVSNAHSPHPVGIGFGGKVKHFRLWIHEELTSGESRSSCTSFARGKLSESPTFKIQTLEVWGCGGAKAEEIQQKAKIQEEKEIEKRRKVKKDLVLETWDSGPSRYIMDLAGKTGVSEPFLEDFRKIKAMREKQRAEQEKKLRQKKEDE